MDPSAGTARLLRQIYERLDGHFGNLHWWPAETPFEVIVGAILTQNTAWRNVTYAVTRLREASLLTPHSLHQLPVEELAAFIRSSGYYRVKAARLRAFVAFLCGEYEGHLERMFAEDTWPLRKRLLQVKGIGEETADSILLYAGGKPVFVVDAYTRRIFMRHGIIEGGESYGTIQTLCMAHLPEDVPVYKQYHALIVQTGKTFCRKEGACHACPLKGL